MAKLVINSYEEFASHLGQKLGESEWLQVDQDRINKFADATLDPQWIHVGRRACQGREPLPQHNRSRLSYPVIAPLHVAADYRSEQPENDGKLRYGRDAFRSASHHRFPCSPRSYLA